MQLWLDVPPHPSIAIGTGWLEALQAHLLAALASACSRCATGGSNSTVLAQAGSSAPAAGGDKAAIIAAVVQAMKIANPCRALCEKPCACVAGRDVGASGRR